MDREHLDCRIPCEHTLGDALGLLTFAIPAGLKTGFGFLLLLLTD